MDRNGGGVKKREGAGEEKKGAERDAERRIKRVEREG